MAALVFRISFPPPPLLQDGFKRALVSTLHLHYFIEPFNYLTFIHLTPSFALTPSFTLTLHYLTLRYPKSSLSDFAIDQSTIFLDLANNFKVVGSPKILSRLIISRQQRGR